jgi:hypothetical protein
MTTWSAAAQCGLVTLPRRHTCRIIVVPTWERTTELSPAWSVSTATGDSAATSTLDGTVTEVAAELPCPE